MLRFWLAGLLVLLLAVAPAHPQLTGNHPEWDRWCGKVYKSGFPSFDPGGQTLPPSPAPGAPLLHVQFKPRYSLYLAGESQGEFVVNAELSQYFGQPWTNASAGPSNRFVFSINLVENDDILVENKITAGDTGKLFSFDLSRLTPSLKPIHVVLYGAPEGGTPTWTATSEILYLPDKKKGSVTRLDNLYGGMHFQERSLGEQVSAAACVWLLCLVRRFPGRQQDQHHSGIRRLGAQCDDPSHPLRQLGRCVCLYGQD